MRLVAETGLIVSTNHNHRKWLLLKGETYKKATEGDQNFNVATMDSNRLE